MGKLACMIVATLFLGCGSSAQPESGPQDTIDTVIQAAAANDNGTIAASFTHSAQRKYLPHFSDPTKMREFGDSLSRAEPIDRMENFAVYRSTFSKNGGTYTYFLYLVKDESGKWKFDTF